LYEQVSSQSPPVQLLKRKLCTQWSRSDEPLLASLASERRFHEDRGDNTNYRKLAELPDCLFCRSANNEPYAALKIWLVIGLAVGVG